MHYGRQLHVSLKFSCLILVAVLAAEAVHGKWQEHSIRQGDGRGGWIRRPALRQVLKFPDSEYTMPFGLVQMDNGEIAILCSREMQPSQGDMVIDPTRCHE